MRYVFFGLLLFVCGFSTAANAKHRHHGNHERQVSAHNRLSGNHNARPRRYAHHVIGGARTVLAHPAGCPGTSFCGCGAAMEVFGKPIRELWLAANWFRFPPASPAPGMVAVRQHHVMVIREVTGQGRAIVFDANAGHHATLIHEVSLSGYSIRDPHRGG